jgi:glucose-6-phosphate dehydrogenase assembly protein OpcA
MVALHRRDTAELLAEELRRLDPDEVYAETLGALDLSAPPELPAAATEVTVGDGE